MPQEHLGGVSSHSVPAFVRSDDRPTSADGASNIISSRMSISPSPWANLTSQSCRNSHLQGMDANKKTKVTKSMLSI